MGKIAMVCVVTVAAASVLATEAQAQAPVSVPTHQTRTFGTLKIIGCLFGVGSFIAGNTVLIAKIRKANGIVKFAKGLWHAKSAEQRAKLVYNTFGTLSGATALIAACTP
jgi:arylsulfatase A-like enzyme